VSRSSPAAADHLPELVRAADVHEEQITISRFPAALDDEQVTFADTGPFLAIGRLHEAGSLRERHEERFGCELVSVEMIYRSWIAKRCLVARLAGAERAVSRDIAR
jgi:hypothetical protein